MTPRGAYDPGAFKLDHIEYRRPIFRKYNTNASFIFQPIPRISNLGSERFREYYEALCVHKKPPKVKIMDADGNGHE